MVFIFTLWIGNGAVLESYNRHILRWYAWDLPVLVFCKVT